MLLNKMKIGNSIEKKIKLRIVFSVILIVLGAASLYVGNFVELASGNSEYSSGFYGGLGCGVIAASVITIIKNIRLLRNEEAKREREIYESDERNKMIGLKCWSYAGYAMFLILYVAMLIAGAIDVVIMNTLLVVIGVFALCLLVARIVVEKVM